MLTALIGLILFVLGAQKAIRMRGRIKPDASISDVQVLRATLQNALLSWGFLVLGLFLIATRSFLIVGPYEVAHLNRVYLGDSMKPGQIVALSGQKGPQADVLPPGFHFIPLVRVLNDVEFLPVIEIPEGSYGKLVARDGIPLRDGQFLADEWPEAKLMDMLDANYFLTEGAGQKGPQLTVLRPGRYRINHYLFEVNRAKALDVDTGHVAVIRSNVETGLRENATLKRMEISETTRVVPAVLGEDADGHPVVITPEKTIPDVEIALREAPIDSCPDVIRTSGGETGKTVAAPVVPRGCIGVWDEPLPPGRYYLNDDAYVATIIPTRLQTWPYKGGYMERKINLEVTDEGKIKQTIHEPKEPLPVPKDAADQAIMVRVEGWTVPVEVRVVAQVHPQDAPFVVASVGDLQRIEDSIITPTIRDILRTIAGDKDRRVLDFIEKRDEIIAEVERVVAIEAKKAGVTIQEARLGEPAIPPELLVARLREQLAMQLENTYIQERKAQLERVAKEQARATADQQDVLVKADIDRQAAEFRKEQLRLEGEGERLKLEEIAKGQREQVRVLGEDRTTQLQMLEKVLNAALQVPEIIKTPMVNVNGSGLEGSAAVLGSLLGESTLSRMVNNSNQKP